MLSSCFAWLDAHPAAYWAGCIPATLALVAWIGAGLRSASAVPARRREGIFALLLLVFLLAWRWPYLFAAYEYNPDESQFIAGALTLTHDPVFWLSVDGTTSGPLNFYALLPLHALGLPLDYFGVRLTGLLLCWIALCLLQRLVRSLAPPAVAQLAILPGAVFFASVTERDFVHYSSETAALALLAWAVAWAARRPLAAAFLAGWLPWAKLQAVPLAAALVAWQLWQAWYESRPVPGRLARRWGALVASAAAPTILVAGAAACFGQLGHVVRRYFVQNLTYVGDGLPRSAALREMAGHSAESICFLLWGAAFLVGLGIAYFKYRPRPSRFFWLGAALTGAAVFCVAMPARPSLHYLLFLTVPALLWLGAALADLWPRVANRTIAAGMVGVGALLPLGWRLSEPVPEMFGQFAEHWRQPYTPLGSILHYWRLPGSRLAVWGWLNSAYAEAGLPQGARDTLTGWAIQPSPQRDYYRATYLADLERNRPELFVDAVGPGSPFIHDRAAQGHETFPALAEFVARNYRLVADLESARIYVRTDFLAAHPLTTAQLQQLVARGRQEYDQPVAAARVVPATAPISQADGYRVQMIEPPAEMLWPLQGTERKVRLEFGFHPKAYTEGNTDGAEFIAELRMPGQPPLQVYQRALDPLHQPADRGLLAAEVDLPPFPAGTTLAVRATPGPAGNAAWDWVYFHQLQFSRSPFYAPRQFPGFTRRPDRIDAAYPYLADLEPDRLLMLPPPTALTFVLDGSERQLNFAYGLAEGAYTGSGQTDGVIYRVTLERAATTPRVIFERHLTPLARAEDRGRQSADVALPADVRAGDKLVLDIDAGGSDSWDWSYLAELDLH